MGSGSGSPAVLPALPSSSTAVLKLLRRAHPISHEPVYPPPDTVER